MKVLATAMTAFGMIRLLDYFYPPKPALHWVVYLVILLSGIAIYVFHDEKEAA